MENNKTLILKESELIDFISYIVTDVIKEQEQEWLFTPSGELGTVTNPHPKTPSSTRDAVVGEYYVNTSTGSIMKFVPGYKINKYKTKPNHYTHTGEYAYKPAPKTPADWTPGVNYSPALTLAYFPCDYSSYGGATYGQIQPRYKGSENNATNQWVHVNTKAGNSLLSLISAIYSRSEWGKTSQGRCTEGMFNSGKSGWEETLYENLQEGRFCVRNGFLHNNGLQNYVRTTYGEAHGMPNYLAAWALEVVGPGNWERQCDLNALVMGKVDSDWNDPLYNFFTSLGTWKALEYIADAIGIIALFFGPVGWIVSGVAGLVSAFAMYQLDNKGGAGVVVLLELIPGFKLFKHFKHLNKFKKVPTDEIIKAFKYFEEPGEAAYKSLTKDSKAIVNYSMKNKEIIAPLLKNTDEVIKARAVIADIKTIDKFVIYKTTPAGVKHGIDKMSWVDFQKMQKSLTTSEKVMIKITDTFKAATPFVIGAIPALYGISWAMYGANKWVFQSIINDTDDLITSAWSRQTEKMKDDDYHYRYDRVLNQTYPYNRGFKKTLSDGAIGRDEDYTGIFDNAITGMPPNILLLIKLWRDATMFPEIIPVKDSCVGVELEEVANPGGGWRPNLDCLEPYNLNRVTGKIETMSTEIATSIDGFATQLQNGEINLSEAQKLVGDSLNLEVAEYGKLEFPTYQSIEDSVSSGDWEIW